MPYIQLVEFNTKHQADEVRRAFDAWLDASRGQRTLRMAVVATDHERPNHFWELLEFASEDDAAQVAELPETKAAYQRWSSLLDGEPAFHNDLQDAARSLCPPIDEALAAVAATGAGGVLVSGSGPTVFGVYDDRERALAAAEAVGGIAADPVGAAFGAVVEA